MRLKAGVVLALLVSAAAAGANPPASSLRPVIKQDVFPVALSHFAPSRSIRPRLRPAQPTVRPSQSASLAQPLLNASKLKPQKKKEAKLTRTSSGQKIVRLCRDRSIQGTEVGRVPAKLRGCGVANAVKVYAVSGVRLSSPVVMDCDTAKTLNSWVDGGMSRAVGRTGGGVTKIQVAAGYACRTRNSRPGAKISEHGKGKAIDIGGFHLADGGRISVLKDWGRGKKGRILRKMHKSACGPFGTVLGPESDRFHKDHFHFDTARHRGGSYCR